MKINIRTGERQLEIYREKIGVALYSVFLATLCLAFGIGFIHLGLEEKGAYMFLVIGLVFTVFGVLLLANLFPLVKRMNNTQGHPLLVANDAGISIAPLLNMALIDHPWSDLSRIVLARKLVTRQSGKKSYSWNLGIFFFKGTAPTKELGLIERSKRQVWQSPKKLDISIVDMPKGEMDLIKRELQRLSGNAIPIEVCSEMLFDYVNDEERCRP